MLDYFIPTYLFSVTHLCDLLRITKLKMFNKVLRIEAKDLIESYIMEMKKQVLAVVPHWQGTGKSINELLNTLKTKGHYLSSGVLRSRLTKLLEEGRITRSKARDGFTWLYYQAISDE